jgi:bacterioferritin-associated ferredoxin
MRNGIDNHSHLRLNHSHAHKALNRMYVCICNAITDKQIRKAADAGARDLWDLQRDLGVGVGCGSCKEMASDILRETAVDAQPRIHRPMAA